MNKNTIVPPPVDSSSCYRCAPQL